MWEESTARTAYLIAAVLVEQYQYQRHHHNHTDHDGSVEDGIDRTLAHSVRVFTEGGVDTVGVMISWLARYQVDESAAWAHATGRFCVWDIQVFIRSCPEDTY